MTDPEPLYKRSRSSLRKEYVNNDQALSDLLERLLDLEPRLWKILGVPDSTQDGLLDARKIVHPAARARHLKHVRAGLRSNDWPAIVRRLEQWIAGHAPSELEGSLTRSAQLAADLIVQGDPALHRFVEDYPDTDRTRLRQLVQNVRRAGEGKKARARSVLEQAVFVAMGRPETNVTNEDASEKEDDEPSSTKDAR